MRKGLGAALLWVLMVVISHLVKHHNTRVEATTDPNDIEALIQLKAAIDPATIDATSCVGSWDFSVDPCENRFREQFTCGIDCTNDDNTTAPSNGSEGLHQRVTSLQLDNSGYGGALSPWVGNLTALQFLRVSGNSLTGDIPDTIGKLSQLIMFDLSFNNFSGSIPHGVGNLINLQTLNLAHNQLKGPLPASLNKLSNVTELRLESNQLNGSFPDLSELSLLQMLDASDNRLSGFFPWALPPSLCSICLRNNCLRGKLPKTISNLNQLNVLDLSNNQFTGCVNDVLLAHPSLQQLNLSTNKLTQLRAHGKHIIKSPLVALDLSYNLMTGPLPSFFALMRHLSSLSLRYNFFHGVIPQGYGVKATKNAAGTEPLERLMLDGNYLTGPLPASFMNVASDHAIAASFVDNCFENCPTQFTFCQGKQQKAKILCRLFNP